MKSNYFCDFSTSQFKHTLTSYEQNNHDLSGLCMEPQQIINLSNYLYHANKTKEALNVLNYGKSLYKMIDDFTLMEIQLHILRKKYTEAKKLLDDLIVPNSIDALIERAKLAALCGESMIEKRYFHEILDLSPCTPSVFNFFTYFYATNHMDEKAKMCWSYSAETPSFDHDFYRARISYEYELGMLEEAFKHCDRCIRKFPNDLVLCLYLQSIAFLQHKMTKARRVARYILDLHPNCILALNMIAVLSNL